MGDRLATIDMGYMGLKLKWHVAMAKGIYFQKGVNQEAKIWRVIYS